jgi:hypothetical protein
MTAIAKENFFMWFSSFCRFIRRPHANQNAFEDLRRTEDFRLSEQAWEALSRTMVQYAAYGHTLGGETEDER